MCSWMTIKLVMSEMKELELINHSTGPPDHIASQPLRYNVVMGQYVFLDTTAFARGTALRGPQLQQIARASASGALHVTISEVTVLELKRQIRQGAKNHHATAVAASREAEKLGYAMTISPLPPDQQLESYVDRWLSSAKIDVLPIPSAGIEELVERDLAGTPPFDGKGKGYRDALIWRSFLSWIDSPCFVGDPQKYDIYFVTANSKDFYNAERLKDELIAEIPSGVTVTPVLAVNELLQFVTLPPPKTNKEAAEIEAVRYLTDELNGHELGDSWSAGDIPIENPFLVDLTPVSATVTKEPENPNGEGPWIVRVNADIEYEGYVFKSDYYVAEDTTTLEVNDPDHNRHYLSVYGSDNVDLDVTVEFSDAGVPVVVEQELLPGELDGYGHA